jgi:hypothetical protein
MNAGFDRHFAEEVWEEYALGMRPEEDCGALEEHLLICFACQNLLAEADKYIEAVRAAAALRGKRMRLSKPVMTAATLAAVLFSFWLPFQCH